MINSGLLAEPSNGSLQTMDQVGSTIELPGSTYLYALAFMAVAFVGFSSIVAVIRQTSGRPLSKIQVLLTRSCVEHGFLVAGLSVLPMFLNLFEFPYTFMWRLSSFLAGIVLVAAVGSFLIRYRKATLGWPRFSAWFHFFMVVIVLLGLFANAAGIPTEPKVGFYAFALTFLLVEAADTFLHSLNIFFLQPSKG
jgi:hypothetical protein